MLLTMVLVTAAAAFSMGGGQAQDDMLRDRLPGTWQMVQENGSPAGQVWTIDQKGDKIHVKRTEGDKVVAEFACGTEGAECQGKTEDHKTKVSLWFNGPKLVELETRGSDVVKRRFEMASDGASMQVEVIPVVPAGHTETLRFKRLDTSAQSKPTGQ